MTHGNSSSDHASVQPSASNAQVTPSSVPSSASTNRSSNSPSHSVSTTTSSIAPSSSSSSTTSVSSSRPYRRPNFSGVWRVERQTNMRDFLSSCGVPESNIPLALVASARATQIIRHTKRSFTLTANEITTHYRIVAEAPETDHSASLHEVDTVEEKEMSRTELQDEEEEEEKEDASAELDISQLLASNSMTWIPCNEEEGRDEDEEEKLVVLMLSEGRETERRMRARSRIRNAVSEDRGAEDDERMLVTNRIGAISAETWFRRISSNEINNMQHNADA